MRQGWAWPNAWSIPLASIPLASIPELLQVYVTLANGADSHMLLSILQARLVQCFVSCVPRIIAVIPSEGLIAPLWYETALSRSLTDPGWREKKAFLYNFLVFSMEFYRLLLGLCGSGCGVALFRPKIFLNAQSPYKVWLPFYHSQKLVQHLVQMTLEICWAELGGSQSLQGTEQTYPLCLLVSAEPLTFTTIHLRA